MRRDHICDDDCERTGYLNTGIHNLAGAKRYLKNRWKQRPLPAIRRQPGARFYTTARSGRRHLPLLGPYVSHMTALAAVPRAEQMMREAYPDAWVHIGTASRPDTIHTLFGR